MTARLDHARPVRVLIYEPYPFGKIAGNLRTLMQILRHTDASRTEYLLVAPFDGGFGEHARRLGVPLQLLPPPRRVNRYGGQIVRAGFVDRLLTGVDLVRYNLALRRLARERRVDVLYANSVRTLLTTWIGARLAGVPVLLYVKGQLEHGWMDRLALLLAHRVLFFSTANRDEKYPRLMRFIRRKVAILEIGLDPEQLEAASPEARTRARDTFGLGAGPTMVAVGQLYAPKGFHHLVNAFARVKDELPALRLVIVGDSIIQEHSHYEAQLRDAIASAGLSQRVILTGWREDVLAIVAESDFLVHPSLAEGFGRAVLEAMALGKAVIASRIGGLRDAIEDGVNGFLVDPGDERVLADRIRRLASDTVLRNAMGGAARDTVNRRFLARDKVARLERIFGEMARAS